MSPGPFRRPGGPSGGGRPGGGRPGGGRPGGGRPGGGARPGGRGPSRPPFDRSAVPASGGVAVAAPAEPKTVELPESLAVKDLADLLNVGPVQVIRELMKNGVIANINQVVNREAATAVAIELGFEVTEPAPVEQPTVESLLAEEDEDPSLLQPRPPVVTIMGHVDHGKTSLLDAIRETRVTEREAGGITQHIGAYQVELRGNKITFLDTPGHEAFTAMRARGAQATDIAILVVAADDGVMPQTREAVDHARAAGVPIIVAINKMDKGDANPDRVKQQLAEIGVVAEEYGGDAIMVPVSARRKEGIEEILEMILLVAEMGEFQANPNKAGSGVVIEAKLDKSRGPVATVLVKTGTLKVGDILVAGGAHGKVKALFDDKGRRLRKATPSSPAEVLGLGSVPTAGDIFKVVDDEKLARALAATKVIDSSTDAGSAPVSLEDVYGKIQSGQVKELNIIVKTDVQGSVEPIVVSLNRLQEGDVRARVILSGTGSINESDILLASASAAVIIGFNSRPEPGAKALAEEKKVEIRYYDVIYKMIEDVEKALTGMLEPTYSEVIDGHAEVRQTFKAGKTDVIAGCMVTDGKALRSDSVRVIRAGGVVFTGKLASLRRFKEDAREVATGYECGVHIDGFNTIQVGDVIEFFRLEKD